VNVELVERARTGDADAFEELASPLYPRLRRVAFSIVGEVSMAEDAIQQAMLDVWRGLPGLRDPERFESYCYRVLTNACHSEGRRRQRWTRPLPHLGHETEATDEVRVVNDQDQLERGFRRLSLEHRTVIVLHYYADMTHEQMADAIGVPVGTARSRLHRAMAALRAALDAAERSDLTGPERREVAP
jgi:RNA polymerase sigma-70 factor (ECF subfamily)